MFSPTRARRWIALESLEERANPAWTISLAGNAVAFTSPDSYDTLTLSRDPAGFLEHDVFDTRFASPIDLNPDQAGVQSRLVNNLTNLSVTGSFGSFLAISDINKNATLRVDGLNVGLEASPNANATLTNNRLTVTTPGFRYNLTGVGSATVTAGAGNNRLDAATFSGQVTLYGQDGNDTLTGGESADYLDGGAGNDSLVGNAGTDALVAGPGADRYDGGSDADSLSDDVTANATVTDTAITVDGTTTTNPRVETVQLTGSDAANNVNGGGFTLGALTVYGNGGNDTLTGGAGDDFLYGNDGDDSLAGNAGNDTLFADTYAGGNDTLTGGTGDDYLEAGAGDDSYDAGADTDTISDALGEGASYDAVLTDTTVTIGKDGGPAVVVTHHAEAFYLNGGPGNDRIDLSAFTRNAAYTFGWDGNDTLIGTAFADQLYGGTGNDSIAAGDGDDYVQGDNGNDTLIGEAGRDQLEGGQGNDLVDGGAGDDRVIGDYFTFNGTPSLPGDGDDTLLGGDGNDDLFANGGEDAYDAGPGTDNLQDVLGDGDDLMVLTDTTFTLNGGPAVEHHGEYLRFWGGDGNDTLDATGMDFLWATLDGDAGDDSLVGTDRADQLTGGPGNDTLIGAGGNDNLFGSGEDDLLDGGDGSDYLQSAEGDDTLLGGDGFDRLDAGAGDDTYDAGPGLDTLNDDLFDPTVEGGVAVITDDLITLQRKTGANESFAHHAERMEVGGSGGNDVIDAGGFLNGAVAIYGGDGDDRLVAAQGVSILGSFYQSFLWGQGGNDTLIGGVQKDYLNGDMGDDSLVGGDGSDNMEGAYGNDTMDGGGGDDYVLGGPGANLLTGGDGDDILHSGGGGGDGTPSPPFEGGSADGGGGTDIFGLFGTFEDDDLTVAEGLVTYNGATVPYAAVESLFISASSGTDAGRQTGPVTVPYTVHGLEPTVVANPALAYPTRVLGGTGSFVDIGAGQTWSATVDYGDGGGPEPLALDPVQGSVENGHTFALDHTYTQAGTYTVTVAVTDAEGNVGTQTTTVTVAPVVTQVRVYYGNGASTFATFDQLAGRTLPWLNLSRVEVYFSDDVSVQAADLQVTGPGSPSASGFAYSAALKRATWVVGGQLPRGRYTFTLDGDSGLAIADRQTGIKLAGGATAGSDYVRQLGYLPGDVTGDGVVTQADVNAANAAVGGPYSPFADVNGDGVVDIRDVRAVQNRVGTGL